MDSAAVTLRTKSPAKRVHWVNVYKMIKHGDRAAALLALWMTAAPKMAQSSDNQD